VAAYLAAADSLPTHPSLPSKDVETQRTLLEMVQDNQALLSTNISEVPLTGIVLWVPGMELLREFLVGVGLDTERFTDGNWMGTHPSLPSKDVETQRTLLEMVQDNQALLSTNRAAPRVSCWGGPGY
jgi:ribosomal protein S15P/S13E